MKLEERLKADGFEGVDPVLFYRSKTLGSNFSLHPIQLPCPWCGDMVTYPTCEHRYQAMKATNESEHNWVVGAKTAFESKERGRKVELRDPWGEHYGTFAYYVMLETVLAKATQHAEVRYWLLQTGKRPIYEDSPVDDIWGWQCRGDYRGRNLLGRAWMEVRDLLAAS